MSAFTVIGSEGFVGRHVVAKLREQGAEPFCPRRDTQSLWTTDLGRVIYCAGLTGDYRSRPFATVEAHVSRFAQVVEKASFDRIVYLSSTRLYGLLVDGTGKETRSIPVDPANVEHLYELSKMLGENLTLHHTGGRGVVARLSYVFAWDDGAQGFLSNWLRTARETRSLSLDSSPSVARDYIHVEDVADALVTLARGNCSEIVNVARGEAISNSEIADQFRERGWSVNFSREGRAQAPAVAIDSTKLSELGLQPRPALPLIGGYLAGLHSASLRQ